MFYSRLCLSLCAFLSSSHCYKFAFVPLTHFRGRRMCAIIFMSLYRTCISTAGKESHSLGARVFGISTYMMPPPDFICFFFLYCSSSWICVWCVQPLCSTFYCFFFPLKYSAAFDRHCFDALHRTQHVNEMHLHYLMCYAIATSPELAAATADEKWNEMIDRKNLLACTAHASRM